MEENYIKKNIQNVSKKIKLLLLNRQNILKIKEDQIKEKRKNNNLLTIRVIKNLVNLMINSLNIMMKNENHCKNCINQVRI